jgi:hypothetical protein
MLLQLYDKANGAKAPLKLRYLQLLPLTGAGPAGCSFHRLLTARVWQKASYIKHARCLQGYKACVQHLIFPAGLASAASNSTAAA